MTEESQEPEEEKDIVPNNFREDLQSIINREEILVKRLDDLHGTLLGGEKKGKERFDNFLRSEDSFRRIARFLYSDQIQEWLQELEERDDLPEEARSVVDKFRGRHPWLEDEMNRWALEDKGFFGPWTSSNVDWGLEKRWQIPYIHEQLFSGIRKVSDVRLPLNFYFREVMSKTNRTKEILKEVDREELSESFLEDLKDDSEKNIELSQELLEELEEMIQEEK